MMLLDHGDPAHVAAEAEFVALVDEILRRAKGDTHAMMLGTTEAYDPLAHDSKTVINESNGSSLGNE